MFPTVTSSCPHGVLTPLSARGGRVQQQQRAAAVRTASAARRPHRGHLSTYADADAPTRDSATASTSRRAGLLGAATLLVVGRPALAEVATEKKKLPKAYKEDCNKLVTTLIVSVQLDRDGAKEAEVRRKADEAKDQVKVFVNRWRDDPRTKYETATREVGAALKILGNFYLNNGQRTRLPASIADEVLGHLELAETYLNDLN